MFEILIMKFRLVLLMILHATIAHIQYVSAMIVDIDIRPLHISPRRPQAKRRAYVHDPVGG
jgi:hypothetical protein